MDLVCDLTQEVYVRLLAHDRRALRSFRGTSDLEARVYLARIARAVVRDHLRRAMSQKRAAYLLSIDGGPDDDAGDLGATLEADERTAPDRLFDDRQALECLQRLLASTKGANVTRDALVFQLHVIEGLSAREIASIASLDMTVAAVEASIRRTRNRLRAMIDSETGLST